MIYLKNRFDCILLGIAKYAISLLDNVISKGTQSLPFEIRLELDTQSALIVRFDYLVVCNYEIYFGRLLNEVIMQACNKTTADLDKFIVTIRVSHDNIAIINDFASKPVINIVHSVPFGQMFDQIFGGFLVRGQILHQKLYGIDPIKGVVTFKNMPDAICCRLFMLFYLIYNKRMVRKYHFGDAGKFDKFIFYTLHHNVRIVYCFDAIIKGGYAIRRNLHLRKTKLRICARNLFFNPVSCIPRRARSYNNTNKTLISIDPELGATWPINMQLGIGRSYQLQLLICQQIVWNGACQVWHIAPNRVATYAEKADARDRAPHAIRSDTHLPMPIELTPQRKGFSQQTTQQRFEFVDAKTGSRKIGVIAKLAADELADAAVAPEALMKLIIVQTSALLSLGPDVLSGVALAAFEFVRYPIAELRQNREAACATPV